jgi:hypothetical protein
VNSWTEDERSLISDADSLRLFAVADSSESVELGMVIFDSGLYVRSFRGPQSRWYQLALESGQGTISIGGWSKTVQFEPSANQDAEIEPAYAAKYGRAGRLVTHPSARTATLRLTPA